MRVTSQGLIRMSLRSSGYGLRPYGSMAILVTGADGFIGSHLVEALVRAGREVRAVALYNSFDTRGWLDTLPDDVLSSLEVIMSDVRDSHAMRAALTGCDSVLH